MMISFNFRYGSYFLIAILFIQCTNGVQEELDSDIDMDKDGIVASIDCNDNDAEIGADLDGDGFCSGEDCDDLDSLVFIGASCDDDSLESINDVYNENCECVGVNPNVFIDTRDGYIYDIVRIGNQTWMAENMTFDNGNYFCYNNLPDKCEFYGKLYDWQSALSVCPEGWHLPSNDEWIVLLDTLGGSGIAGGEMKTIEYWQAPNAGATNSSGFNGLPGALRLNSGAPIDDEFEYAFFWTSDEVNASIGVSRGLNFYARDCNQNSFPKNYGLYCRCLKDE